MVLICRNNRLPFPITSGYIGKGGVYHEQTDICNCATGGNLCPPLLSRPCRRTTAAHQSQARDGSSSTSAPAPTTTGWAAVKAEADARKAAFDAAKAASDSEKAATEAKTAAGVAKVGTVTGQSTIPGVVTMGTYGAKAEALLLVTRSTKMAAAEIAPQLVPALKAHSTSIVLILTGTNELATPEAIQFDLQLRGVAEALRLARAYYAAADQADTPRIKVKEAANAGTTRIAPLAAAGAIIDELAKLGSYFQSDYSFGSVEVGDTHGLVANALVNELRGGANNVTNQIDIPRNLVASDAQALIAALDPAQTEYLAIVAEQAVGRQRAAALHKSDGVKAAAAAAIFDRADVAATLAVAAYDKLMTGLLADPVEGKEPLAVRIIRQKAIQSKLADNPLILLLNSEAAAAYYTKKNLWTFLGGPPLYTMGGVSLTYTLYENNSGAVLAAGTAGKHGGYRSVRKVEKLFP